MAFEGADVMINVSIMYDMLPLLIIRSTLEIYICVYYSARRCPTNTSPIERTKLVSPLYNLRTIYLDLENDGGLAFTELEFSSESDAQASSL